MKNPVKPLDKNDLKDIRKNTADFVQITRGYLSDMEKLTAKSPAAIRILLFLSQRMTKQNAIVISQKTLGEILNLSKPTVLKAVTLLSAENWIQIVKIGTSNGYLINSKVAWRSYNEQRFGYFNAEVIVSESEQKQTIEELENQPLKEIPNVKLGETPISDNADLLPPDQKDLLEPDFKVIPVLNADGVVDDKTVGLFEQLEK